MLLHASSTRSMPRRVIRTVFAFLFIATVCMPMVSAAPGSPAGGLASFAIMPPEVTAKSVFAIDMTSGVELYAKNQHEHLQVGSVVKIATALVVVNNVELDEQVVIIESDLVDTTEFSNMALNAGDTLTVSQLLYGLLIPSGNDGAHALARHVGAKLSGSTDPRVKDAERHLAQARKGATKLPDAHRPNRRDTANVQALLTDAAKAQARGDWITPPGDSAWDKLRAARALAPDDARVQRALAALEPAARNCQADALRENRLREAQACLDVWRQLDPLSPELSPARSRIAQRWIAVGDQRLERGEIDAAAQAAEQARLLDSATPGLTEFTQRLRRAQPGKP